ncbi:MAG: efflux RND transporter permease subunit, partial [Desulfotomaculaceae bacterium]|nr:efflux RND transporter permease subunit [Desulfotomaculaceae bacterium]
MKLADISVNRPVAISMLMIAMVVLGLFSLNRLAIDLYPDMEIPVSIVTTSYSGASPAEIEELISKPLESALATTENVDTIQSVSAQGISLVIVQFNWNTNMDTAINDMRDKIDMVKSMLPDDVDSTRVMKLNPNQMPIIVFSISGAGGDLVRLNKIAEDDIQPRLERLKGVASVYITGGKTREIKVILDPAKMEAYGLNITQVMQAIAADNINGTAGKVDRGSSETIIRVVGEYKSPDQLKQVQVGLANNNSITLKDLATLEDSFKEMNQFTYTDGQTTLGMSVMKATGGNTVQIANEVLAEVEELNKTLPDGVKITTMMDTSKFIKGSINNILEHGLLGAIFAVIILYLFLRKVRTTLVVALTIPISIIATFALMYFTDQTINLLTLGGLLLGMGSLIDFSVVVLESIFRYRQNGYGIMEAAKQGTAEVGTAVTASATAQCVVFAPILMVAGIAGVLFKPMALTVIFSHIAALFVALTMIPMLSARLLKDVPPTDEALPEGKTINPVIHFGRLIGLLKAYYGRLIAWSLQNRKKVVGFTVVLFIASVAAVPLIGT